MPITLTEYLHARGFTANPFATSNAEREAEMLPSFFVRAPWFDWLVGDPTNPESLILFAPQGYGKTSHRLEVARRAGDRVSDQALVITINDISPLIRIGIDNLTLDDIIAQIRSRVLETLDQQLLQAPARQAQFEQDAASAVAFHAMLRMFVPRRAIGRSISAEVEEYIAALRSETIGPKTWLKDLAALASAAGYASVYCLLDNFDELKETRERPEVIFNLLSHLLDAPSLLEECNFAFKFFLPQSIQDEMLRRGVGRLDRIPHRVLSWTDEQLLKMLSQRLVSYNRSSTTSPLTRVRTFHDLCNASFDTDVYIVQAAAGSPRRLFAIARHILEEHCLHVNDLNERINKVTIEVATRQVLAEQVNGYQVVTSAAELLEQTVPALIEINLPEPQPVRPLEQHTPKLHIDDRGDIWLGKNRLSQKLPSLMRRCLEFLWVNRYQRVSYDELQQHLYKNLEQRGDPQSSMEKLIRRLRQTLEPGRPSGQTYIETQTGSGYVLRNFSDTLS